MAITKASGNAVSPAAKGDLVAGSATNDAAVLGVGANGTVLTAASGEATGLQWATPSSGGMTLIEEAVLSNVTSFSFSSIPQTYKQLYLAFNGINSNGGTTQGSIRLNNNSSSVYVVQSMDTRNSATSVNNILTSSLSTNENQIFGNNVQGDINPEGHVNGYLLIDNYVSTTKFKGLSYRFGYTKSDSTREHSDVVGSFRSTSAVTSIDIVRISGSGSFSNRDTTSIRLYGIS